MKKTKKKASTSSEQSSREQLRRVLNTIDKNTQRSKPTPEATSPYALKRKPSNQITGWDVPRGMDPDDLVLES